MSLYAIYEIAVLGEAEYTEEGVGYTTMHDDFPMVLGANVVYDTIDIQMKPWGRDTNGYPLFVNETATRWTATITQHGITSTSDVVSPVLGTTPAVALVRAQVSNAGSIGAIDGGAKNFVLGVKEEDLVDGDPIPPVLEPYGYDTPFPDARWDDLETWLIARDVSAVQLAIWRSNHPDATPRDFGLRFRDFINAQNRANNE